MSTVAKLGAFLWEYFRANLAMAMEYRANFVIQVFGMVLNDALWVFFWWLFFNRFPQVAGWSYQELLLLYAVLTLGFGLGIGVMGNCTRLSQIIAEGHLDFYLALPKNVLLHVLVSRMNVSALGDVVFGLIVYGFSGAVSWENTAMLFAISILAAVIFVSFAVLAHSLTFFIGNANALAGQMFNALITFSSYPGGLFKGFARVLMFTAIPAGFISYAPVGILGERKLDFVLAMACFSLVLGALAIVVFYRGLKRYESGNLVSIRL